MEKFNIDKSKKVKVPYQVPENYFELMTEGIQQRIQTRKNTSVWASYRLKLALVPALLVLIALVVFWPNPPKVQHASMDQLFEDISNDEIEQYLSFTNVSEYELASAIESIEEVPESDNYLQGIDLEEGDVDDILLEFDILNESIDS